jgi:dTDP-4-dehydrorhamnose 3,5-epimerase-like enzyme
VINLGKRKEHIINENGEECQECVRCNQLLIISKFRTHGTYTDGKTKYYTICIKCENEYARNNSKLYYSNLSDKAKEINNEQLRERRKNDDEYRENRNKKANENRSMKRSNENYRKKELLRDNIKRKERFKNPDIRNNVLIKRRKRYEKLDTRMRILEQNRARYKDDSIRLRILKQQREDRKAHPEKYRISDAKHKFARLGYGNNYINEPFTNSDFHHLGTDEFGNHDPDTTVCYPHELHKGGHCIYSTNIKRKKHGYGMIEKNTEVYLWYKEAYPKDINKIIYLEKVVAATKKRIENGWENAQGWGE